MLTPEDLERRRGYITATDVPAICGFSPWRNAADVYHAKVHGVDTPTNDAMDAGNLLEPSVLAWAGTQLGEIIPGEWRVGTNGINAATLDAMTTTMEPVEAKTSGITGPGTPHHWGPAGTDEIPQYYLLQVHAQLLVTGAELAYVPALIGGRGFVMYEVYRSKQICDQIATLSEQFWRDHIQADVPPPDVLPSMDTLKYLRRRPKSVVAVSDDLVLRWQEAKAAAKEANDYRDECQRELLAAIGDAEAAEWSGGQVTYLQQTKKGHYVNGSTYRVIREKKGK